MKRQRGHGQHSSCSSCCSCEHYGRRAFLGRLGAAGGSALALKMGLFGAATAEVLGAARAAGAGEKPVIRVAFSREDVESYFMGWPGAAYDIAASQQRYIEIMKGAAERLGLALDITGEPLTTAEEGEAFAAETVEKEPLGALLVVTSLNTGWPAVQGFLENRGELPTLVFAPQGMQFTPHLQPYRTMPRVFVGTTQHVEWLETAMGMFQAMWRMKSTRMATIAGDEEREETLAPLGTVLHHMPLAYFAELYDGTADCAEAEEIAAAYTRGAEDIVEPDQAEILEAARTYVANRQLMEAKGCHAVTMDCLGLVTARRTPPPCMAYLQLMNEGTCGACERDVPAALSLLLSSYLLGKPAFLHNPSPNTVHNTYMGAHCTAPTKMDGFDAEESPYILRSHHESDLGVAPQVILREEQEVTLMKFINPGSLMAASGKILTNIETQPDDGVGGCRTAFEMTVDGVTDSRDIRGHHNVLIYGNHLPMLRAYCQFAGIEASHIAGGPM